jgi:phosphoglycolate phosphatase-like HAD superfamily hydrolase
MSKAIVFDLDGTLVDSAPDLMDAHNYDFKFFERRRKKIRSEYS